MRRGTARLIASGHLVAIGLAVGAAFSFGTAEALQLREAVAIPKEKALRPGLLLRLMRRGRWLLGGLCDGLGFVLLTLAIWQGSLVLVYPLITLALVWTLALLAMWYHEPLHRSEWLAVASVIGGLGVFTAITGSSEKLAGQATGAAWIVFGVCSAVALTVVGSLALRSEGRRRAILFALAGGFADTALAVVVAGLSSRFDLGFGAIISSWEIYAVIAVGIIDLLFKQTAYQAGYATITLPIMTVTDPLLSVVLGSLFFGEKAWASGPWLVPAVLGLGVMSAGLMRLSREPRLVLNRV